MDSETEQRQRDGMHHLVVPPDADVHELLGFIRHKMDIDVFSQWHVRDLDDMLEQGNAAIAVDHACCAQAKHILGRGVRLGQAEFAKQAVAFISSSRKADVGDLSRGGMDLVVVAINLSLQHTAHFIYGGQIFVDTGSNDAIL